MMKKILTLFVFLCSANLAICQQFRFTTFAGSSNYNGDFQKKRFTFNNAHPAFGIGLEYELTSHLYLNTGIRYGKISGTDAGSINVKRNLNFTTDITEFEVGVQYDFINLNAGPVTPFIATGIAIFHFNPFTRDSNKQKTFLQPLGTEGQGFFMGRKKYNLIQFSIPFGAGVKFVLSQNTRVSIEAGFRKTFTDYLDDVSLTYVDKQALLAHNGAKSLELSFRGDELNYRLPYPAQGVRRGNPSGKDWYYFTGISFSFSLEAISIFNEKLKYRIDCPTNVL